MKRTLEEIAAAEDSNDEDYDDRAPGPSRSRAHRSRRPDHHVRKKQRRGGYRGSDVDSDDEEIESDEEESYNETSDEDVERNEKGRPVRRSTKKPITYEESDSDEEEATSSDTSHSEEATKSKRQRGPRTLIIKLKTGKTTPTPASAPPTRTLRLRSTSQGAKHPPTSAPVAAQPTRRSSRLSHDEEEHMVALTNSGHHVEIVREGSRDPEGIPSRAMKGGKGLKYPSKSTIDEEEEGHYPKEEEVGEPEIKASQQEDPEFDPQAQVETEELPRIVSDIREAANQGLENDSVHVVQDSDVEAHEDDEDDGPVLRGRTRAQRLPVSSPLDDADTGSRQLRPRTDDTSKRPSRTRKKAQEESSDFEPQNEQENEDDVSSSSASQSSPRKRMQRNDDYESSNGGRRSARLRKKGSRGQSSEEEEDELAAEVEDLKRDSKKKRPVREEIIFEPRGRRRGGQRPNYDIMRGIPTIEDEEEVSVPTPSQQRNRRGGGGGGWQRNLFNIHGPFGGAGGLPPIFGGAPGPGAEGDVDSDSSDEETMKRPKPIGGTVGMTPTSAFPGGFNLFPPAQTLNSDPAQAGAGTPANLGKIKDKQALADADPLGVDQNVSFESVGGLQGHIDQLKEMVSLPLLYPEIFQRFHIVPPRGVLFYGPPGTGKTLLARALASSVSSQGKKVTFYMRKGADALSKWVGEAERQLRLLFEEARKNQPSIIFFDEIDGLAPVRSSKQDQIHASIVSTLLALMDGMDGRGQVIIIGATNRPDSIDPALRRPGRFDREFYFPLPDTEARRAILDIHTKGWSPPLDPSIKDQLAKLTKGYGGADLRALCTEAALNAVQRRYPQIYSSNEKLLIDPKTIEVTPKDFMISVRKMIPSSQRSASSGASPLPQIVEPLLRRPLSEILTTLKDLLPQRKKTTALEEAQYEDTADGHSFKRELMQQSFETSRVFRPRLLIHGKPGMGQQYLAAAILNHFEGFHVQAFDLPTLHGDSASSPEATLIRLFSEVKMHTPSVIYLPNVQEWYQTVGPATVSTFLGLLRSVKPTDPILLLGFLEAEKGEIDEQMQRDLFGYSKKTQFELPLPSRESRYEFFAPLSDYIRLPPDRFPDPSARRKRTLETLRIVPPEPEKAAPPLSATEIKAQKKRDRQTLNALKIRLQPIMDQIRTKYKKFRTGVIDDSQIRYLFDEADPGTVTSDVATDLRNKASFRPYEIGQDKHGEPGLVDQSDGRFYYNIDTVTIERRLSNGYYKRPKDFLADVKRLAKDARTIGDEDRLLKANELLANVEVDVGMIEMEVAFCAECERVYQRELEREKEAIEKARKSAADNREMPPPRLVSNVPHGGASEPSANSVSTGPVRLGEPLMNGRPYLNRPMPTTPSRPPSHSTVLTNGLRPADGRNGSSSHEGGHEADVEDDTPMGGMGSHPTSNERSHETQKTQTTSSFGQSAQPRPVHSYTAPSQQVRKESGMSGPLSQTGILTPMAPGSQAADYQNEASTTQTTSDKKNSGPSSNEKNPPHPNTQELGPDLFLLQENRSEGGSQLPSTLGMANAHSHVVRLSSLTRKVADPILYTETRQLSQPESNASQSQPNGLDQPLSSHAQVAPAARPSEGPAQARRPTNPDINDLLNPPEKENFVSVERKILENFHQDITDKTSGLSVEQLEQVNSILMDTLWRTRGEWHRPKVLDEVTKSFGDVIQDMEEAGQEFADSSWEVHGKRV